MPSSTDQDLADNYQKKTQLEHIKDAPDTYIGSVEKDTIKNWTLVDEKMKFLTDSPISVSSNSKVLVKLFV